MASPLRICALTGIVLASASVFSTGLAVAAPLYSDGFEPGTGFVVKSGNAFFGGGEGTSEGSNAVVFNSGNVEANGVVAQTFATTAGQQYLVEFDYGNFNSIQTTLQRVQAEFRDGSSSTSGTQLIDSGSGQVTTISGATVTNDNAAHVIQVSDSTAGPNLHTAAPNAELSAVSFTFTAISTSSTLVFRDQAAGGEDATDGILDNVRITAVPEPTTLGLLGIAGLGLLGRRRRGA